MATKQNGKKRTSPSVERQLALALIAVIESAKDLNGNGDREIAVRSAAADGQKLLNANGYSDLESIPTRVKRLKAGIDAALEAEDFDVLAKLGQEMKRARKGLPPLTTEKKTRKPRKPKEPKETKAVPEQLPGKRTPKPKSDDDPVAVERVCTQCGWKGKTAFPEPCPKCSATTEAK